MLLVLVPFGVVSVSLPGSGGFFRLLKLAESPIVWFLPRFRTVGVYGPGEGLRSRFGAVSYITDQSSKYSVKVTKSNTPAKHSPAITGNHSQAASDVNQSNTSTVVNANSERYGISGRSIPNHPTTAGSPSQSRVEIASTPWVTASIVKHDSTSQATATPLVSSSSISLPEPSREPASLPKVIPLYFLSLVQYLEKLRLKGISTPLRSVVSLDLTGTDRQIYERAGCIKFKDFASRAENMGLIRLGIEGGKAWIGLHPDLHGKIEIPG
ncbi:hypothetical protein F5050DRAFT_1806633 [Lentinula boryana]|uniref:Uncharacterized protein n=1 Tax=Lentinula boryana TaxID=40481 RepID=A0ABQ8QGI6_9AGAR|nr:hypothetical protein F5050DRAFT_1806633 [Lentinula boryana]